MDFKLVSDYVPTGDQPEAIDRIAQVSSKSFSLKMLLNTLFHTMTTINQRPMLPTVIPI